MNPQNPTSQANQASANLGFINTMQEHLLKYKGQQKGATQPQNSPETSKNALGQENLPKDNKEPQGSIKQENKDTQGIDMITKKVDILDSQMKLGFDSITKLLEKDKVGDKNTEN